MLTQKTKMSKKPKTKNHLAFRQAGKLKTHKGFSFIEVMMAIFLIVVGLVSAMSLLASSMNQTMDSRNQIAAGLLAQEGVELVRNLRDTNWVAGRTSFDASNFPVSDSDSMTDDCRIDKTMLSINCTVSSDKNLAIDSDGDKFYKHQIGQGKFQRKIIIVYDTGSAADATGADITSVVVWGSAAFPSAPISDNCNTAAKCAYAKATLSRWGE